MPKRQEDLRIPYAGFESLGEELLSEPGESELEMQRLESQNRCLELENKHLRSALATCGRVLEPYLRRRLNGQGHE